MEKTVLALFAHPDDAEILCSGTLSLLSKAGWHVHIATMTPGDKGTTRHSRDEISRIRKEEAARSAEYIGARYHCLEEEDLYILYTRESIDKTTSLMRKVKPLMVITSPPRDYMVDHEITSKIVRSACFATGIKNMDCPEKPFGPTPHLYYSDPIEGVDIYGQKISPNIYVDVSSEMELREKMLACHESQRSWLQSHHQMDEYIQAMKDFSAQRGKECGCRYAEGFIQHAGHGYPRQDILSETLSEHIMSPKSY